jgi:hypothetical protein
LKRAGAERDRLHRQVTKLSAQLALDDVTDGRVRLALRPESWETIFATIHGVGTKIESAGNFWAAVQSLEGQFGERARNELVTKGEPCQQRNS